MVQVQDAAGCALCDEEGQRRRLLWNEVDVN